VFHAQWFAEINWAAPALGVAALVQAALMGLFALTPAAGASCGGWAADGPRRRIGLLLLSLGVVAGPCMPLLGVRTEVFGLTPDATALGTLGLLLCVTTARPALAVLSWPVPLWSTMLGAATAWALRA
jgi:hypothetical protein